MDNFEYVMFGRIFKYEDSPSGASNQVCNHAEGFCRPQICPSCMPSPFLPGTCCPACSHTMDNLHCASLSKHSCWHMQSSSQLHQTICLVSCCSRRYHQVPFAGMSVGA